MRKLWSFWPLAAAVAVFLLDVWYLYGAIVTKTGGTFTYPLDDSYIHMAVARNLAVRGVWGIRPDAFASCSSSPLWTLLLAAIYKLAGFSEFLPLLLASACGVGLLAAVFALLRRYRVGGAASLALLLAVVFLTPMPALALAGLEHLLHALLTVLALDAGARLLADPSAPGQPRRGGLFLLLLLPFLVATRYEGLFLAAALAVLLLLRKRFLLALVGAAGAALPVVVYGWVSRAHGWLFLPNSIVAKKAQFSLNHLGDAFFALGGRALAQLGWSPYLVSLLLALGLGVYLHRRAVGKGFWEPLTLMTILLGATALMHLQCAGIGWFFRYDAYLMAAGLAVLALLLSAPVRSVSLADTPWLALAAAGAFALAMIYPALRGFDAQRHAALAGKNIFQQQCQMARFIETYYGDSCVALNDIGAVAFYSRTRCFDLWGLADRSTASARLEKRFGPSVIARLAKENNVRIAIVYPEWFRPSGGLPPEWRGVGQWELSDNYICAGKMVTFYAVGAGAADELRRNLAEFSRALPPGVNVYPPRLDARLATRPGR
ncbi:MAG: hypothetical protein NTV86_12245 [Planctomycetota bacterium]|nr:hypothetical protein [Planctomycetota bacterium]